MPRKKTPPAPPLTRVLCALPMLCALLSLECSIFGQIFTALWMLLLIALPVFFAVQPALLSHAIERVFICYFASIAIAFITLHPYDLSSFEPLFLIGTAVPLLAAWHIAIHRASSYSKASRVGYAFVFSLLLIGSSFLPYSIANVKFDHSAPQLISACVVSTSRWHTKSGWKHAAELAYFDEQNTQQTFRVSIKAHEYKLLTADMPAQLYLYSGALHIPYCTYSFPSLE